MQSNFIQKTKFFLKDKNIFWPIIAGIIFWAVAFGIAYVQIFPLEKNLILHFNFNRQVDAIGSAADVFWIIFGMTIIFLMDQLFALALYFKEKIISYLVSYLGAFFMLLGLFVIYYLSLAN